MAGDKAEPEAFVSWLGVRRESPGFPKFITLSDPIPTGRAEMVFPGVTGSLEGGRKLARWRTYSTRANKDSTTAVVMVRCERRRYDGLPSSALHGLLVVACSRENR
jgi:hypothetical protein